MFAKRLFYASASLFLLAAAYHLGASAAGAQAGSSVVATDVNGSVHAVVGRVLIERGGGTTTVAPTSIPGSSPVMAAGAIVGSSTFGAVLANGDYYEASGPGGLNNIGAWQLVGNSPPRRRRRARHRGVPSRRNTGSRLVGGQDKRIVACA